MINITAKYDYHLHTNFSNDSEALMEDVVKKAISLGLAEIALTDHYDYIYPNLPFPYQIDYDLYFKEFSRIKDKYANEISIIFGIELGIGPYLGETISELFNSYNFDFAIGSIHDINGREFYIDNFFAGKEKQDSYNYYLQYLLDSIRNIKEICVVGHMDYISRYSGYDDPFMNYDEFSDGIDEVLKELISRGKGIEINTSGYRYGIDNIYPHQDILRRYRELGGEIITVGSDAHRVKDIAKDFDKAYMFLKQAGFKYITIYRNLKPEFIKI